MCVCVFTDLLFLLVVTVIIRGGFRETHYIFFFIFMLHLKKESRIDDKL